MGKIKNLYIYLKNYFYARKKCLMKICIIFVLIAFILFIYHHDFLISLKHPILFFKLIYIELILIYLVLIIRNLFESFKINPLLTSIGISIWGYMSYIIIIEKSKILTFGFMNKFLISLTIVGTLLFAFIPQGLLMINEKYKPKNKQLFSEYKLSKELTIIIYSLIMFVGIYLLDMLLGLFFSMNKSINYYLDPKISTNLTILYKILSIFYMAALSFGISMLIYAFIKIVNIVQYFYFYEMDFEKLKSKYKYFNNYDLDWIINKKLYSYFINKYEIKLPGILIDKFDLIAKDNPKLRNKKIIKQILKDDKEGEILIKINTKDKVK
jgi:hypothetical protein